MKKAISLVIMILVIVLFSSCARVNKPKLPANYFYKGSYIDIHTPNSEGWSLMDKSTSQIVFAKYGKKNNESYIAQVVFFPLETTKTKEDFLNLVKTQASKSSNKERYIVLESSFQLYEKRSYPCALAKQIFKDTMAKTSLFSTEELFMQVKSLYCEDPKSEGRGFMIGYSFRGSSLDKNFDAEADSFIKGVQFSDIK